MDLKALIAKMDQIESKKFLTEDEDRKPAKKQEREVELPSGAKVKATKVQGWQSQRADKEADKDSKRKDEGIIFRSAIAQELLREFNLSEEEFKFSPEQEKWLGGANRQDPYIIARMPGPKPPLSYFTNPEDQAIAKQMNIGQGNLNSVKNFLGMKPGDAQTFADPSTAKTRGTGQAAGAAAPAGGQAASPAAPAAPAGGQAASPAAPAAPAGVQAQGDDEGNTMITTPDGQTKVVGPDGNVIPPGGGKAAPAGGQAASPAKPAGTQAQVDDEGNTMITKPDGSVQVTGPDGKVIPPGGGKAQAAAPAAGGQAASPAAPAAPTSTQVQTDDEGNHMITTPDGKTMVVGPDGKPLPNGGKAQTAANPDGAAEGGNTAATAAATAAAPAAGGQAASPAAPAAGGRSDPKVKALQDKLIAAGAKIKADGIMGPKTRQAMKDFPQAVSGNVPLPQGVAPSTAGGGRGGQGGPTAAQAASASRPAAGGQAASPAAGGAAAVPATADKKKPYWVNGTRYEYRQGRGGGRWVATATPEDKLQWNSTRARSMSKFTGADDEYKPGGGTAVAGSAPAGGQAASPAPAKESVGYGEEQILVRIKQLAGL